MKHQSNRFAAFAFVLAASLALPALSWANDDDLLDKNAFAEFCKIDTIERAPTPSDANGKLDSCDPKNEAIYADALSKYKKLGETAQARSKRVSSIKLGREAFAKQQEAQKKRDTLAAQLAEKEKSLKAAQAARDKFPEDSDSYLGLEQQVATQELDVQMTRDQLANLEKEIVAYQASIEKAQRDFDNADKPEVVSNTEVANTEVAKTEEKKDAPQVNQTNPSEQTKTEVQVNGTTNNTSSTTVTVGSTSSSAETNTAKIEPKVEAKVETPSEKKEAQKLREIKAEALQLGKISVKLIDGKVSSLEELADGDFKKRVNACVRSSQDSLAPYLANQTYKDAQIEIRVAEIPATEDMSGALAKVDYTMPMAGVAEAFQGDDQEDAVLFQEGKAATSAKITLDLPVTSSGRLVCKGASKAMAEKLKLEPAKTQEEQVLAPVLAKIENVNQSNVQLGESNPDANRNLASSIDARIESNLRLAKTLGFDMEARPDGTLIFKRSSSGAL